jgi:hypothetical protein
VVTGIIPIQLLATVVLVVVEVVILHQRAVGELVFQVRAIMEEPPLLQIQQVVVAVAQVKLVVMLLLVLAETEEMDLLIQYLE